MSMTITSAINHIALALRADRNSGIADASPKRVQEVVDQAIAQMDSADAHGIVAVLQADRSFANSSERVWKGAFGASKAAFVSAMNVAVQKFHGGAAAALAGAHLVTQTQTVSAQKVVSDALAQWFKDVDVDFKKSADGKTDLVDVSRLPMTMQPWFLGGNVEFDTKFGKKSDEELREFLKDAQDKAGITAQIELTFLILE